MEIERKFTIRQLPENLSDYSCLIIEQAYLNTNPVIRIRREDDRYYMTYKGEGLMAREEYNLPLNAESYAHLLPKADGNVISKKRYLIPIETPCFSQDFLMQTPVPQQTKSSLRSPASQQAVSSLDPAVQTTPDDWRPVIELDVFAAPFEGLIIAEVEFPSIETANAFVPPAWFEKDVTNDPSYHNSNLAKRESV